MLRSQLCVTNGEHRSEAGLDVACHALSALLALLGASRTRIGRSHAINRPVRHSLLVLALIAGQGLGACLRATSVGWLSVPEAACGK